MFLVTPLSSMEGSGSQAFWATFSTTPEIFFDSEKKKTYTTTHFGKLKPRSQADVCNKGPGQKKSQQPREYPLGREKWGRGERGILRSTSVEYKLGLLQEIEEKVEIPFIYTFGSWSVFLLIWPQRDRVLRHLGRIKGFAFTVRPSCSLLPQWR